MNLVLLCKRRNHHKVIDILEAFREHDLRLSGIIALDQPVKAPGLRDLARKVIRRKSSLFRTANSVPHKTDESSGILLNHTSGNHTSLPLSISANGRGTSRIDPQLPEARKLRNSLPELLKQHESVATQFPSQGYSVDEYAQKHGIPITVVRDLNGPECEAAMHRFAADLLILGGTPIIRANILSLPRRGTLNVHMAALPRYRGMNVAEWSIFHGDPVAVTVHFVDAGVDTGSILLQEHIDVSQCHSLEAMRKTLSQKQHRVLAKSVKLLNENQLHPRPQRRSEGRQYYVMHDRLRSLVEKKLGSGYSPPVAPGL